MMSTFQVIQVDTKGKCFVCWNGCPGSGSQGNDNHLTSIAGFEKFLKYIKVDITQLFHKSRDTLQSVGIDKYVPVITNDKVEVGVSLCVVCSLIVEKFGELYQQSIKLQCAYRMQLSIEVKELLYQEWKIVKQHFDRCVKSVNQLMNNADDCPHRLEEYRARMEPQHFIDMFNFNFARNLRREMFEKCSSQLESNPRGVTPSPPVENGATVEAGTLRPSPSTSGGNVNFSGNVNLSPSTSPGSSAGNDTSSTIRCQKNGSPVSAVSITGCDLPSTSGFSSRLNVRSASAVTPVPEIRNDHSRFLRSPDPMALTPKIRVVDIAQLKGNDSSDDDDDTSIPMDFEDSLDRVANSPVGVSLASPPSTSSTVHPLVPIKILCVICENSFPSQTLLDHHMRKESCQDRKQIYAKCTTCGESITCGTKTQDKSCHGHFTDTCSFCINGAPFAFRSSLRNHVLGSHFIRMVMREIPRTDGELRPVADRILDEMCYQRQTCGLCPEPKSDFTSNTSLKAHLRFNHFNELVQKIRAVLEQEPAQDKA